MEENVIEASVKVKEEVARPHYIKHATNELFIAALINDMNLVAEKGKSRYSSRFPKIEPPFSLVKEEVVVKSDEEILEDANKEITKLEEQIIEEPAPPPEPKKPKKIMAAPPGKKPKSAEKKEKPKPKKPFNPGVVDKRKKKNNP